MSKEAPSRYIINVLEIGVEHGGKPYQGIFCIESRIQQSDLRGGHRSKLLHRLQHVVRCKGMDARPHDPDFGDVFEMSTYLSRWQKEQAVLTSWKQKAESMYRHTVDSIRQWFNDYQKWINHYHCLVLKNKRDSFDVRVLNFWLSKCELTTGLEWGWIQEPQLPRPTLVRHHRLIFMSDINAMAVQLVQDADNMPSDITERQMLDCLLLQTLNLTDPSLIEARTIAVCMLAYNVQVFQEFVSKWRSKLAARVAVINF